MRPMNYGIILLALLLAAMAMVPMVSAGEPVKSNAVSSLALTKLIDNPESITGSCPAVQNQEKVIASLIGKDMTAAEFYEKIYPGCMDKLPENVRNIYAATKMKWLLHEPAAAPKALSKTEADAIISKLQNNPSGSLESPEQLAVAADIPLSLNGISVAWKGRTTIYQSSTTTDPNSVAMTYMSTKSMLWMFQNGQFNNIAEKFVYGFLTSSQTARGSKAVDPGLFQVLGEHYGIAPLGYYPVEVLGYSNSQYFYVE